MRQYKAHGETKPELRIGTESEGGTCNGSLYAQGLIIGTITRRSMRMANGIVTKETLDILHPQSFTEQDASATEVSWRTLTASRTETLSSDTRPELWGTLRQTPESQSSGIDTEELLEQDQPSDMRTFLETIRDTVWNRRTFQATSLRSPDRTLVGLGPQRTEIGDRVCILYGCSVPVILRPRKDEEGREFWILIGEAYVFGCMDGEAVRDAGTSGIEATEVEFEIR